VGERLTTLSTSPGDWQTHKNRIVEALEDLERNVREAALRIH
jgi:hypothetical protein